jgi:membrane-bound serine protease (ClpP class)
MIYTEGLFELFNHGTIINYTGVYMLKKVRIAIFIVFVLLGLSSLAVQADSPRIKVLQVDGVINPVSADYVIKGIEDAKNAGDYAVIIELDTPGGLYDSMMDMVQGILDAEIPVIVYVSPSGSRAASAGVFVTMAGHTAAMSPNTVIGAAHPVSISSEGSEQEMSEEMSEKVTNDAVAYIRSIAETRGRNADWVEEAVRESVSIDEKEALKQNVIDIVASDLDDLLAQMNGRVVTLAGGEEITLDTIDAEIYRSDMNLIEDFLFTITNPNIAYILLSIGSLGIMAEIFNPGMIFPGVVGAISLVLSFYSLGMMPVNWAGVVLIILAFGLFIAEVFTSGFGLLFGCGIAAFLVGSIILFKGGFGTMPVYQVDWWLIALVIVIIAGFVVFAVYKIVGTYKRQATTGREDLNGKIAEVRETLNPKGIVFFKGELWKAVSESGIIEAGEEVVISDIDGLILKVKKIKE